MGNGRILFETRALVGALLLFVLVSSVAGQTNEVVPEPSALRETERQTPDGNSENWSWHVQNTDILQGYPAFSARYSGPNSLRSGGEIRETVSLDLLLAVRLWPGAEAHLDGLMWQGFGFTDTRGIVGFP